MFTPFFFEKFVILPIAVLLPLAYMIYEFICYLKSKKKFRTSSLSSFLMEAELNHLHPFGNLVPIF